MADDRAETTTYNSRGEVATKSIQGRALDPSGALAVEQRMKGTDLGALARAAQAKKTQASKEVQKKALAPQKKEGEK